MTDKSAPDRVLSIEAGMYKVYLTQQCKSCHGKGYYERDPVNEPCYECKGSGQVPTKDGKKIIKLIERYSDV